MAYSDKVIDHFENPRNMGSLDKQDPNVGTGIVGAPECGDVMRLQIKVTDGVIEDAKFKTFGCGSAIASSSLATEWIKGKTVDEAMAIKNTDIVEELALPPVKIHCSVLAEDAIKAAVGNFRVNSLVKLLAGDDATAALEAAKTLLALEPAPQDAAAAREQAAQGQGELAAVATLAATRLKIHAKLGGLESLNPSERAQAAEELAGFDPAAFDVKALEALKRAADGDDAAAQAAQQTLNTLEASGKLATQAQA